MKFNFYTMNNDKLKSSIADIRDWLWKFEGHESYSKMSFVLEVACSARDIRETQKTDPFVASAVDIFTS